MNCLAFNGVRASVRSTTHDRRRLNCYVRSKIISSLMKKNEIKYSFQSLLVSRWATHFSRALSVAKDPIRTSTSMSSVLHAIKVALQGISALSSENLSRVPAHRSLHFAEWNFQTVLGHCPCPCRGKMTPESVQSRIKLPGAFWHTNTGNRISDRENGERKKRKEKKATVSFSSSRRRRSKS